jgi:hypothetical protein
MSSQLAEDLSRQTRDLVDRFEKRADSFTGRKDLAQLALGVDVADAEDFARLRFGEGEHVATGIDGSMDYDERLQMILFYSNATAYDCPFNVGPKITFDLASVHRNSRLGASAAVPLWAEDLASVFSAQPEIDIELEHSMERIPNSFMTLGELYLANLATERSRIIFLDRPISGTFSTLSRDARNLLKRGESKLDRWGSGDVSLLDIYLAVNLGASSVPVPKRRRFHRLGVLAGLVNGKSLAEASKSLGLSESERGRVVKNIVALDRQYGNQLLSDSGPSSLKLTERAMGYWSRVSKLALGYSKAVFEQRRHPLAVSQEDYLTILDVNAMSLVTLWLLCDQARRRGVLLIGIAKDTTATDVTRAVLPYSMESGSIRLSSQPPRLKNDRAFLAILSTENPAIRTPWRTPSYDSAFSTMLKTDKGFIAARGVVSREQLYVRSFFQLRSLKTDPSIRSQVFLFDRQFDPALDGGSVRQMTVSERSGRTSIGAYFEGNDGSRLSNLILHVLSLTDNPEVFEAFGHNQLLYLADKAVKAEVKLLRSSLRGVADLRLGGAASRKKIFGLTTSYREQRAEAEHARMRSASR